MPGQPLSMLFGKRYVLLNQLGEGGMGIVYQALDRLTGDIVALKQVLTPTGNLMFDSLDHNDPHQLALAREFQTLATLRHPNIISVLDYGFAKFDDADSSPRPYFTMTLLDEPKTILEASQGMNIEGKIYLLQQTLQALAYLHRRGIIHRDVKPANVLVTADNHVKVLDFGLAIKDIRNEVKPDGLVGTVPYMAPEVLRGEPSSERSDLYAIGVIAYEMLVGHHPYSTKTLAGLIYEILNTSPDIQPFVSLDFASQDTSNLEQWIKTSNLEIDTLKLNTADVEAFVNRPDNDNTIDMTRQFPLDRFNEPDIKRVTHTDIQQEQFVSPGGYLAAVVLRLMVKDPYLRYQHAMEVMRDFNRVLTEPFPLETAETRESFLQAATFVGREEELACLATALAYTLQGKGSAWLVGGESGVGKSRLIEELRIRALVEGALVIRGQGVADGGVPYRLWRDALRRLMLATQVSDFQASVLKQVIPDISHLLERTVPDAQELKGVEAQQRLFSTVSELFQNHDHPTVIILEDLHWASESLDILKTLIPLTSDLPLLIIGSFRNDERPELTDILSEAQLLLLDRLTQDAITDLSTSMLGDTGRQPEVLELLQRESEGNVFFLVEVVRVLAEEAGLLENIGRDGLPETVFAGGIEKVIQRRLSRIPASAHELLEIAALAGRQLNLPLLKTIATTHLDTINIEKWTQECANASIIDLHDGQWRFAHDKLREGMLLEIENTIRPTLHRYIAEGMENIYDDPAIYTIALAHHWQHAGNREKERHYATLAGEQQFKISAYHEAIRYFERALALVGDVQTNEQHTQVAYLKQQIGMSHERIDDYSTAQVYLQDSLTIAETLHDTRGVANALIGLSEVSRMIGKFTQAQEYLEQSLAFAQVLNDQALNAYIFNGLGTIGWLQNEYVEARKCYKIALETARQMNNKSLIANSLRGLGNISLIFKEYDESKQYLRESQQLFREIGDRDSLGKALTSLGEIERELGNYDAAKNYYEAGINIFKEINTPMLIAVNYINLGMVALEQDQLNDAGDYLKKAIKVSTLHRAIPYIIHLLLSVGTLLTRKGDSEMAVKIFSALTSHTVSDQDVHNRSHQFLKQLESKLPSDIYATAYQSGQNVDIELILQSLLSINL